MDGKRHYAPDGTGFQAAAMLGGQSASRMAHDTNKSRGEQMKR